ncbi:nicotinate phosphoribosyltransferase [Rickenella mellea]|uniref:Nicotinate phosphoribosyltransferase n=1 Tax=Rickenella mellea TaxID=50990 RepID=A0A4Y7Q296_9AGAM|nr:nicotinate phosphoribosyltransferase [Rickenella mellea]
MTIEPEELEYAVPGSLLDTDLYKLTMQQAVLQHFPDVTATYKFTHRDADVLFSKTCVDTFRESLPHFANMALTSAELSFLQTSCPFFTPSYLSYLSAFRFKPVQVSVNFIPSKNDAERGRVDIVAAGPWIETIMWEVPLMACLSETYFTMDDRDWSEDGQNQLAYNKAKTLLGADVQFSEFGTRRRRSYATQDLVVHEIVRAAKDLPGQGNFMGTSNVSLAMKYSVKPIGTIAHEWFMGVAALKGYEHANATALDLWEAVYPQGPLLALTDTFSTGVFLKEFAADPERARRWKGLRQDSGDPFVYAPRAKETYESIGIDHRDKTIIYSDSLDVDKALRLKRQCDEVGFIPSFGIGTFFTNDFRSISSGGKSKSRALNMVIKLSSVDGKPCIKISDEITKNTGDRETVNEVKALYGLPL